MKILRARLVLPISLPAISDGYVAIEEGEIVAFGRTADLTGGEVEDLGEVILLPGLINAHCHLDYTGLKNVILYSGSFSGWVRRLNDIKRTLTDADYLEAIAAGFRELRRWGTTTVFNIESFPELMVRMPPPPIRAWWFYELLDIRSRIHTEDLVAGALGFFEDLPNWLGGSGLSPHAPYTTSLELYKLTRACCEQYHMPLMTHLAETVEEYEMFTHARGPLYDFLAPIGRDMSDTGSKTPIQHLLESDVLPHGALLTHMNVLSEKDWEIIARCSGDFSVVHCPNCHIYFERPPFDLARFYRLRVNLCLGTDSLASNGGLNLFGEMRTAQFHHPDIPSFELLKMVTMNPARAIGQAGKLGEIAAGAKADLIAIPYSGSPQDAVRAVISYRDPVDWLMVNGQNI